MLSDHNGIKLDHNGIKLEVSNRKIAGNPPNTWGGKAVATAYSMCSV